MNKDSDLEGLIKPSWIDKLLLILWPIGWIIGRLKELEGKHRDREDKDKS